MTTELLDPPATTARDDASREGRPARDRTIEARCSAPYAEWAARLAAARRCPIATLIDQALAERLAAATHQGGRVPEVGATIIFAWGETESLGIVTVVRGPTQIDLRYQVLDSLSGVPYGPGRANCWAPLPDAPLPAGNRTESAPEGGTVVIYRNPAFAPASGRRDALVNYEATVRVGGPCPTLEWAEPEDAKAVNHGPGSGPRHWRFPDEIPPAVAPAALKPEPGAPAEGRHVEVGDAATLILDDGSTARGQVSRVYGIAADSRVDIAIARVDLIKSVRHIGRITNIKYANLSASDNLGWAFTPDGSYDRDRKSTVGMSVHLWADGRTETARVVSIRHEGPPALLDVEVDRAEFARGCVPGDIPGTYRRPPLIPAREPRPQLVEALV